MTALRLPDLCPVIGAGKTTSCWAPSAFRDRGLVVQPFKADLIMLTLPFIFAPGATLTIWTAAAA